MAHCVLKVKTDRNVQKLVTVRSSGEELQLCCVDRQTGGTTVQIFTRFEGNKIQNAFSFMYENNSYFPMVNGKFLKLEAGTQSNSGPDSERCWFERKTVSSGEHYTLRSVVNPQSYLSLSGNKKGSRRIILGLSEYYDESVPVTDEYVQ